MHYKVIDEDQHCGFLFIRFFFLFCAYELLTENIPQISFTVTNHFLSKCRGKREYINLGIKIEILIRVDSCNFNGTLPWLQWYWKHFSSVSMTMVSSQLNYSISIFISIIFRDDFGRRNALNAENLLSSRLFPSIL